MNICGYINLCLFFNLSKKNYKHCINRPKAMNFQRLWMYFAKSFIRKII